MTAILRHTTTSNAREEFQESPTSSSESEDDSFVRENNVPKKDDILNLDDKGINSSFERKKLLGVLLFAVMLGLVLIFLCTSQFFQLSFFFQQDSSDPISSIIHFDDPIEKFPKQATDSMNATLFPFLEIDEAIQKAHNQLYVSGFCIGKHLIRYDYQDAFPIVDSTKYPHRILDCGEDAFVTFHDPLSKLSLLAVADGVGGWADRGVDSSVCAWLLMKKALFFFQQDLNFKRKKQSEEEEDQEHPNSATKKRGNEGQGYILNAAYPRTLLNRAYAEIVTETGNKVIGSATVCLGVIDHSKDRLYTVNIGDSGFLLYRPRSRHEAKESSNSCNGNMIIKSQEQQHAFNFPYQLSPHLGYCLEADLPSSGMLYEVDLLPDDILFFASDGIFDNLYDSDLCHFFDDAHQQLVAEGEKGSRKDSMSDSVREPLSEHVQKGQRQHILRLVQSAILKGQDIRYRSPFSVNAQRAGRPFYGGGKLDDSTAVMMIYKSLKA